MNKKFWKEFIELYRENTCLWDIKSKDYINKAKRKSSYDILFKKFKELFPEATIEAMKKKINNIRTSFRRELKKVEDSKCTASGTDDIYQPSLWYYNLLLFTAESEIGNQEKPNIVIKMEVEEKDTNNFHNEDVDYSLTSPYTPTSTEELADCQLELITESITSPSHKTITPVLKPTSFSRKRRSINPKKMHSNSLKERKMALYKASEKTSAAEKSDDEFNITGKRFAFQLKKLDDQQRLIAEKLWADIIFYGAQGKLQLNCSINIPSK